jgi:hypothetical protein
MGSTPGIMVAAGEDESPGRRQRLAKSWKELQAVARSWAVIMWKRKRRNDVVTGASTPNVFCAVMRRHRVAAGPGGVNQTRNGLGCPISRQQIKREIKSNGIEAKRGMK